MVTYIIFSVIVVPLLLDSTVADPDNITYSIVAPDAFRPGSLYTLSVICFNADSDVDLTLRLQDSSNVSLVQKTESFITGKAKSVSLQIPDSVPVANYELVAIGQGGLSFEARHVISVKRVTFLLFVQTDKAMYKPGQTVLFRVIALHPDLKPYKGFVDIAIYDLAGNRIMQWLQQKNDTGVISQSLKLSDQTPLGDWKIIVTAGENSFTKTFQVAEYVLPKFEVSLELPRYFLVNVNHPERQEDLKFTVSAKYTYGEMVKGRATVSLQMQQYYQPRLPKKVMNVELKNGKADIQLNFDELLSLVPGQDSRLQLSWSTLSVSADVEEAVSGVILNGNGTVSCKSTKYSLKFLDSSPDNFKPGLLYTGFLQLAQADGSPPDPVDITSHNGEYRLLMIKVTTEIQKNSIYHWLPNVVSSKTDNITETLTASGFIKFSMMINSNVTNVHLEASFWDIGTEQYITDHKYLQPFKSRDNQSIQVSFEGEHGAIKVPDTAKFLVKTTEDITSFQYGIMSKGNILLSGTETGSLSSRHSFSIEITHNLAAKLAPNARVVVWFYTNDGEIIIDSTEVSVSTAFANEVTLSFDRESTTPSENVSLTVNAYSGSYVGLLAVDQSVLLLKSGNDITQDTVISKLNEFSGTRRGQFNYEYDVFNGRKKRSIWYPIFVDGSNSKMILENSGLFVLTDGFVYDKLVDRFLGYADAASDWPFMRKNDFASPPSQDAKAMIETRVNFPETWLWTEAVTSSNGSVMLQTSVPDTITSWIASAFAVSDVKGLGVASTTAKLTVFKQFFISPNLPYSIIRGEEFALQVNVFNYLSVDLDVLVTLQESEFFTASNSSRNIKVESDDAVPVYFWIVAKTLGQIPIHIKAQSAIAGDAMRVMLLVKPEGVQQQYSTSVFLQVSPSDPPITKTLKVSLPPKDVLVPGSEHIELTVIGDIMGPSVKSLDNLLQMPYGCGEQNMLNFAPDVFIVKYLSISDQLTPDIKSKALGFMNAGYQRELTFQRSDGSFSAFGNSDKSGSVWLSSFVIKCFHQALDYIPVDGSKIASTINWIISNQAVDGSFAEPPLGKVIHADMQGGSSRGLSMTAYVLNALLENANNIHVNGAKLQRSITSAQRYLESQLSTAATDPYTLSIIAYTLTRANSSVVTEVLQMLEALAKTEAGTVHWEKAASVHDVDDSEISWHPPYVQARAINIEMTAYALLVYSYQRDLSKSLPIAKWIIAQRNANGGFSSTQDTVMALEALAEFASMTLGSSNERNLEISAKIDEPFIQYNFLPIIAETTSLLQSFELPSNSSEVEVNASGRGSVLVQLNVLYNVYQTLDFSGISLTVNTAQNGNGVKIRSCGRWTKKEGSGMVVMEVNQLTGFKASNVDDLKKQAKKVENKESKVILYFDELTSDETCVSIISNKILPVSNIQDAAIKVYPYYDPSDARTMFYKAPEALAQKTECEECPQCCGVELDESTNHSSIKMLSLWMAISSLLTQLLVTCV